MKRSKIRKTAKKDTLGYWKKQLWTVFSKYIRARDNYTCFTCGKKGSGSGIHAGHLFPKAASGLSLYFDERAVRAQCYYCNINLGGNGAVYSVKYIEKFGQESFDELYRLKTSGFKKYTIEEYKELITLYKTKLKELDERTV